MQTFTIGFGDPAYDEVNEARSTAAAFGADHHEQIVTPDAVKVAEVLAYHYDEPFADASAIPTYYVSELARKHVTVCLSGDGGDELFAGYTPYADALKRVGSSSERALRRELCDFIRRGYHQRLLTSNAGSFSVRVDDDSFLISSKLVDRATITPDQLVLIHQGRRARGTRPSEACHLHQLIYRKHPEIRAIVNATPVNATAFSASAARLDTRTIPESYIFLRDVAVLPFSWVYDAPEKIAETMTPEFPIALIENDCALVLGKTILDAFDRLEVLESTAEAVILSRSLGEVRPMGDDVIEELIQAFLK